MSSFFFSLLFETSSSTFSFSGLRLYQAPVWFPAGVLLFTVGYLTVSVVSLSLHLWLFPTRLNRDCPTVAPVPTRGVNTSRGDQPSAPEKDARRFQIACVVLRVFHRRLKRSPLERPRNETYPLGWKLTICISLHVSIKVLSFLCVGQKKLLITSLLIGVIFPSLLPTHGPIGEPTCAQTLIEI